MINKHNIDGGTGTNKPEKSAQSACNGGLCAPGKLQVQHDHLAEKLDEMADICEYWKKNREKGRMPSAIRMALIMLSRECVFMADNYHT